MPGYTKEQLEAKGATLADYVLCDNCGLYWHRRAYPNGLGVWTRRLGHRPGVPRFAYRTAYSLVAVARLVIVFGVIFGVVSCVLAGYGTVQNADGSQGGRAFGEGISVVMHRSTFGFFIAVVAALWLGFCTWRWRRGSPP